MDRILIAIPSMDTVSVHFCRSLVCLDKLEACSVSFVINSLIYSSRNELARQAIEGGYDYVLWLDSDMVFERDTLQRLMADLDAGHDIVTGLYFRRVRPYSPVLFSRLEIEGKVCWSEGVEDYLDGIFEVAGCGFGCVLMRTSVLREIYEADGPVWFSPIGNVGEDCAFCIRARANGRRIFCDPTVKCGHVSHDIVTEESRRREAGLQPCEQTNKGAIT